MTLRDKMKENKSPSYFILLAIVYLIFFLLLAPKVKAYCPVRDSLLVVAEKEIGVIEETENDAPRIREYQAACGFYTRVKWCACFLTWVFKQVGLPVPHLPARAASWTESNRVATWREVMPGDVASIWDYRENRVSHAFLITATDADFVYTVEGNTRPPFNHDGKDRVMTKLRPWSTVYAFSNQVGDINHTVQPGENLYRISLKYKTTVEEIQRLNNLEGNYIRVGDVLTVKCS